MPPESARPAAVDAPASSTATPATIDASWLQLILHWRVVVADLARHFHVDLYDPDVLARPWPGIRTMIFALIDEPTRLREALTRR